MVEAERLEERFAANGSATLEELTTFQMVTNTLRRVLTTLGLKRRQLDVTPDLSTYLASRRGIADAEAES